MNRNQSHHLPPSDIPAKKLEGEPCADLAGAPARALPITHLPKPPLPSPESSRLDTEINGELPVLGNADLIDEIRESADKLARDHASRGDVKILGRSLKELRYAFKVFAPYRARRKVTIFGSARTLPSEPEYQQTVGFAKRMAAEKWMVITGAGGGIMEAGHVGAGRDNAMGLNILLPFEQHSNSIITGDPKLVHMKYFFTRKLMFVKESDAICLVPGGFGTLDEGLEVLTLLQTGKRDLVPVVMLDAVGGDYWSSLDVFVRRQLLAKKLISPEDLSLYRITSNVDEAVAEVLQFFRVYHSMRFIHGKLALRLAFGLAPSRMEVIQERFADILTEGRFELVPSFPEEKDEPALISLPRLVLHYNRINQGRLRQLIDFINLTPETELTPAGRNGRWTMDNGQ